MKRSRWDLDPAPAKAAPPSPPAAKSAPLPSLPHPLTIGCRSVDNYERISHIDEGTYGIVWKAKEIKTNKIVALKQCKFPENNANGNAGFPMAVLREINVLLALTHPNILPVTEMVMGSASDRVFMVMEFMVCDLKHAVKALPEVMTQGEAKSVMQQLCSAVSYMHSKWFFHRDLKTANILVHSSGKVCICDYGLARKFDNPLKPNYTQMVITLWYRPPELLLGATTYGPEVDIWSLGCIFAELLTLEVLFPGQGEMDQLNRIFKILGVQSEESWPGYSRLPLAGMSFKGSKQSKLRSAFPSNSFSGKTYLNDSGFSLLNGMLECDPKKRAKGVELEGDKYFGEAPAATDVRWNFKD